LHYWNPLSLRATAVSGTIIVGICAYAALTAALGIYDYLYAVAAVYVPAYIYLAWKWPQAALLLIFAAAPMANEVSGGGGPKISAAEVSEDSAGTLASANWCARRLLVS
jgi:hypothetical protein